MLSVNPPKSSQVELRCGEKSVQARSDLCCKYHFDFSLGTNFEILIVAFSQFSVLDRVCDFPCPT